VNRVLLTLAGALGFSAVTLGAFGAHGLRERLTPPMLEVYRTGVLYHLVHALAVLAIALGADRLRRPRLIATLFAAGIAIFSGTLYLLAITSRGVPSGSTIASRWSVSSVGEGRSRT